MSTVPVSAFRLLQVVVVVMSALTVRGAEVAKFAASVEPKMVLAVSDPASTRPEPFGMVVVEAMAMGRPVVASLGGGIMDILDDEVEGLVVPRGDCSKLAEGIVRLLRDRSLCESMGRRGHEKAYRHFSSENSARAIEKIYRCVLAK